MANGAGLTGFGHRARYFERPSSSSPRPPSSLEKPRREPCPALAFAGLSHPFAVQHGESLFAAPFVFFIFLFIRPADDEQSIPAKETTCQRKRSVSPLHEPPSSRAALDQLRQCINPPLLPSSLRMRGGPVRRFTNRTGPSGGARRQAGHQKELTARSLALGPFLGRISSLASPSSADAPLSRARHVPARFVWQRSKSSSPAPLAAKMAARARFRNRPLLVDAAHEKVQCFGSMLPHA
ncbi:hypothetical protein HPB50_020213 [Hyalomma asiaticum]|uniref:Uncharacterized protein n=1 Tax=Hyalomma asiaticum TaxID=266040 RepID=A0ACB7T8R7_HYAAI|nr:hypothetical protein HPB50_020213 [Hyalomma asiaticum]